MHKSIARQKSQAAEADVLRRLTRAFPNAPNIEAARARLQSLEQSCSRCTSRTAQNKIGILFPLSGAGARAGARALRGIELALAMVQERDPALQLSMVVRDSTQNAATAQDALRALVNEEHVVGVIGPLLSRMAIELAPLAGELMCL